MKKSKLKNIPEELQSIKRWINYKLIFNEERGKFDKIPYDVKTNKPISIIDKNNHISFDEACYNFSENIGIGFVFSDEDDIIGIDIDNVQNLDSMTFNDIIAGFNSYFEYSPSKNGVHIIVKGKMPKNSGNRKGNFEVYEKERFFTFTGDVVFHGYNINHNQSFLNYFCNRFLNRKVIDINIDDDFKKVKQLKNFDVKKYQSYLNGTNDYFIESSSHKDYYVAIGLLLENEFDIEKIKNIMKNNPFLYRKKYDRKDYLDRTIKNAINYIKGELNKMNYINKRVKIIRDVVEIENEKGTYLLTSGIFYNKEKQEREFLNIAVRDDSLLYEQLKDNKGKEQYINLKGYFSKKENTIIHNNFYYSFVAISGKIEKEITLYGNICKDYVIKTVGEGDKITHIAQFSVAINDRETEKSKFLNASYFLKDVNEDLSLFTKGTFLKINGRITPNENPEFNDNLTITSFEKIEKKLNKEISEDISEELQEDYEPNI